jgi:sialate O-acetylesterase
MRKSIIFISLLLLSHISTYAQLKLPSIYSDNMVLQQNSEVRIWGWANPSETFKLITSWNNNDTIIVKANNWSFWQTTVKTEIAGGPYSIELLGSRHLKLKNIMFGEVWICSGQSNMSYTANQGIVNKDEEIANANYPNIRILKIPRVAANSPQIDCNANWQECTPETMSSASIIGYTFAKQLHETLNVPIGIIVSAWGGTPAEVWVEETRINSNHEYDNYRYINYHTNWPSEPGAAYNAMIAPLTPYNIAGAIWYQGESNCKTYPVYASMMKTLIEGWRDDFKNDFPFYFVQIAPYNYGDEIHSERLREQQEITAKIVDKTGMVVITDLVDDINQIHPTNKVPVGERLAKFALTETYNKNVGAYKSPTYKEMKIKNSKINITFNDVISGLKCTNDSPITFLIAGEDKKFIKAKAKIKGKIIIVYSDEIKNPVAVRFCFDNITLPDVFTKEGLPLAPFRTDNW